MVFTCVPGLVAVTICSLLCQCVTSSTTDDAYRRQKPGFLTDSDSVLNMQDRDRALNSFGKLLGFNGFGTRDYTKDLSLASSNGGSRSLDHGVRSPYGVKMLGSKRQIRYHQCYFNPISCFRRR